MSKSREVRELQFSSTQLIILFLAILVLGIFIFLLGVSVGKKQTRLTQEANLVRNPVTQAAKRPLPAGPKAEPESTAIDKEIASHAQQSATPKTGVQPQEPGGPAPSGKTGSAALPMAKPPATTPSSSKTTAAPAKTKAGTGAAAVTSKPAAKTTRPTVQSAPAQPKTAPSRVPGQVKGYYYIQLAAFDEKAAADTFASEIRAAGFPTLVLSPLAADKKPWYRVRVGGYPTKEDAEKVVQQLRGVVTGRKFEYWITRD
jgi:cell division protein FtsN